MAQHELVSKPRNAVRVFWDDILDPRRRAIFGGFLIAVALFALFSGGFETVTLGGAGMSLYMGVIISLLLARRGFYADLVSVYVDRDGERVETRQKVRPVLKPDRVQPLHDPRTMSADDAFDMYPSNTRVMGITHGGDVRAYPLAVLSYREVVHDTLGGVPVAVTWSPFCYTSRAYLTSPDTPIKFGSTGRVVINSPVLYDTDTHVRWIQYLGAPLEGPDIDYRLTEIPSVNTTLEAWLDAYPESEVIHDSVAPNIDLFDKYYAGGRTGMHGAPHRDVRWPPKEIIAGVDINDDACAFPMSWLQIEPVVNETVGGTPLVVVYEEPSASVVVFRAQTTGGRTLTFEPGVWEDPTDGLEEEQSGETFGVEDDDGWEGQSEYEPMMMYDTETGSQWQATNGICVEGELAGMQLDSVAGGLSFWFAWTNFHPSTRLPPRPDLSGLAPGVQVPEDDG
ncbi:MAG: DUF3179 domain-containing (seleno)protein [Dehalococcoidia bacterium]